MATTTYYLSAISLIIQYFQNLGLMNAGGFVTTNVGGQVGTPVTTYTDSTGLVENPNPMTLNSAGRPAAASGAPVAFWVPGGTVVQLIVTDSAGNQLVFLDNVPAINDLTNSSSALQTLLASPASSNSSGIGPVAGVDLVANAVKSYSVFATVRAANVPTPAAGQIINIEIEGGTGIGDGLGGFFFWNSTLVASDDGLNILKPTVLASASPGRWQRWTPLGVPQISRAAADQSVSSSTVLANSALSLPLISPGLYEIKLRAFLLGATSTGQGYQVALSFPNGGSTTGPATGVGVATANGTAAAVTVQAASGLVGAAISDGTPDLVDLTFILQMSTPGSPVVQFCQNSSNANATTLKAGSTLMATRIG